MMCPANIAKMHIPVLRREVVEALAPKAGGLYLDGTLGLGGHAEAVLEAAPDSMLCGLDRDAAALELAKERLASFDGRVNYFHLPYSDFPVALRELGWSGVDGAMLDLGVSSPQLDNADRGFSFNASGPLDMRMDQLSGKKSAWHLVNYASFAELREIIAAYGEDPRAGRIARGIVEARRLSPINTTSELAEIVWRSYPPAWRGKSRRHPATRVFQALRMKVNDEPGQLKIFLDSIMAWLKPGARLAIISFHSLEDRMVKRAMKNWAAPSPDNEAPLVKILFKKPVCAGNGEVETNPRASSAKLRVAEKIG